MTGLRRALIALAVAAFALGLAALALVTTSDRDAPTTWVVLALTLGWGFAGAGIYAWWRRPENRVGALMTLVGFVWFLGSLTYANADWAFTIGLLLDNLWVGALVHMLVAFPTGRVAPGLERRLVVLGWLAATALPFATALLQAEPPGCGDCPENLAPGDRQPDRERHRGRDRLHHERRPPRRAHRRAGPPLARRSGRCSAARSPPSCGSDRRSAPSACSSRSRSCSAPRR